MSNSLSAKKALIIFKSAMLTLTIGAFLGFLILGVIVGAATDSADTAIPIAGLAWIAAVVVVGSTVTFRTHTPTGTWQPAHDSATLSTLIAIEPDLTQPDADQDDTWLSEDRAFYRAHCLDHRRTHAVEAYADHLNTFVPNRNWVQPWEHLDPRWTRDIANPWNPFAHGYTRISAFTLDSTEVHILQLIDALHADSADPLDQILPPRNSRSGLTADERRGYRLMRKAAEQTRQALSATELVVQGAPDPHRICRYEELVQAALEARPRRTTRR